jgi:hypothetical protein
MQHLQIEAWSEVPLAKFWTVLMKVPETVFHDVHVGKALFVV